MKQELGGVHHGVVGWLQVGDEPLELKACLVDWQFGKSGNGGRHHVEEVYLGMAFIAEEGEVIVWTIDSWWIELLIENGGFGDIQIGAINEAGSCCLDLLADLGDVSNVEEALHVVRAQNHGESIDVHVVDELIAIACERRSVSIRDAQQHYDSHYHNHQK